MVKHITKQQLVAILSFVIVMVTSLVTIFLFGGREVVLADQESDSLSVKIDGKKWEKPVEAADDKVEVTFKSTQETWVKLPYPTNLMYVSHQAKKETEYGLPFLSVKDFSIKDELTASTKRNKTGKSDTTITSQLFESTEGDKRVIYLRLVPDQDVTLGVYRQSKKAMTLSFDELMGDKRSGQLVSFKKNDQFVSKENLVFPTEEEASKEEASKEEASKEEASKEEASKKNTSIDELKINSHILNYPTNQNYITATLDYFTLFLDITIPPMNSGEIVKLNLGDNGSKFDYSKSSFIIGNYKVTPGDNGNFTIEAVTDTRTGNLNLNIPLRYNENISNDIEEVKLDISLLFKEQSIGVHDSVTVKKYIDIVSPNELVKKVPLGFTKEGNAAWVVYWNYNNYVLGGSSEFPFKFEETPLGNQHIIKETIAAYDVKNPILDDDRNLSHDEYNYMFSYYLQTYFTDGKVSIEKYGPNVIDGISDTSKSYYIYFETDITDFEEESVIENKVSMQASSEGTGVLKDESIASMVRPPSSSGINKISLKVNKLWDDDNNSGNTRPSAIKVQLFANNVATDKIVELNEANQWQYTFLDLEENDKESKKINYEVREVSIPDGYESIISTNEVGDIVITNKIVTGGVELIKTAPDKNKTLSGAVFKLLKQDGTVLKENLVTDADGRLFVDNLIPGEYQLVEIKAPENYELDWTPIKFKIEKNQTEVVKLQMVNQPQTTLPFTGGDNSILIFIILSMITLIISMLVFLFASDLLQIK